MRVAGKSSKVVYCDAAPEDYTDSLLRKVLADQVGVSPFKPSPSLRLSIYQYRARFHSSERPVLSEYTGSAWRGVFGHALREITCLTDQPTCGGCMFRDRCVYSYVFETPPPVTSSKMRLYHSAPHPFVLRPGSANKNEKNMFVYLTLFGRGNEFLPQILQALSRAGEKGLGRRRVPLTLDAVEQLSSTSFGCWEPLEDISGDRFGAVEQESFPPAPRSVKFELVTPLRLVRFGRELKPDDFMFVDLFSNLLRRVSMLQYFHTDTPLETDFAGLVAASRDVKIVEKDLRWHAWQRYSSRQNKKISMDGLVGSFTIEAQNLEPFWPYLWLGQWVHAGKGTSMGLGHYRLVSV